MPRAHPTTFERNSPDERVVTRSLRDTRPGVFWLEEAGPAPERTPLTSEVRADLTVVGGGYLGLWTAVLAKRRNPGQRVVLLEGRSIGWAASGRNGGFCDASLTHGESNGRDRWAEEYEQLEKLGLTNLDALERDVHELGLDCHWERTGELEVAVEPYQLRELEERGGALSTEQVRAEIDSPLFLGAAFHPDCALVQPARLARELARAARELGVEVFEDSPATRVRTPRTGSSVVESPRGRVVTERVVLATNVYRSLLRRNRLRTIPVYDFVLMTEPLSDEQLASVGWQNRQGFGDMANQFHYVRLSRDNRILFGGYDAIYHAGNRVREDYEERSESHRRLAAHFFATFPQLVDVDFSHRWAGAIDTCTQFCAFYGLARRGRVAYAAGFTGLGVGATRFAAETLLDLLGGEETERTGVGMVRDKPWRFPPEPLLSVGVGLTKWSLNRADHREGHRNAFLRGLDAAGLGFDS